MVSWAGVWYVLFKSVWSFHTSIYPGHVLKDFWQQGIDFRSGILSFLMVFPLMPGAMAVGFMLANIFFWLLPWSRKAFETEAGGHPGTDFQNTMRRLFIICIWTLPAGLIASIIAAYLLKNLR